MSASGFEVVVIGGGVTGSSIAYHLARQGRRVLVVERASPAVEPAASWASAGGVRRQGRHPAEAPLASEAIDRWPTLSEELDADLAYQQRGNLRAAIGEDAAEQTARIRRAATRQRLRRRAPARPRRSTGDRARPRRPRPGRQLQPERRPGRSGPHHARVRCRRSASRRDLLERHRDPGAALPR